MKKYEKEVHQAFLDEEKRVLDKLEDSYAEALVDINNRIEMLMARDDADLSHVIYQIEYQQSLKTQVQAVLEQLQVDEFNTISEYLTNSYNNGFIGAVYSMHKQGVPLLIPIDPEQVAEAIRHETKLTSTLYTALGLDIKDLQRKISGEISRGISSGQGYGDIARNIAAYAKIPMNNAMRIARTESHRIQCKSTMDAQYKAKEKGADVLKQWDSTLDGNTRPNHRKLDGQIRELDEPFEIGGMKAMYPGNFGRASEDCNCRCALLQRARWALDEEELSTLQERAEYFGLDKTEDFNEYREKYLDAVGSGQTGNSAMKLEFPDDVYKVNGFTEDVKKEVDRAMEKLNNEYDIRLNSIVVEPSKDEGDIFVTGYHDGVVDMVVNANADFRQIIERIPELYQSRYYAGNSLEDYLAHEMAHCMLYQDCTTDEEYRARYAKVESLYRNLQGISIYADRKESGNEALAEAFVRVRNNEEVSPIAESLVDAYFSRWKK